MEWTVIDTIYYISVNIFFGSAVYYQIILEYCLRYLDRSSSKYYLILKSRYSYTRELVHHFFTMVDRQFVQNTGTVVGAETGSVGVAIISSSSLGENPTDNKWAIPKEVLAKQQREEANGKKIQLTDNMSTMDRLTLFAGEIVGTAILVFLGCMGCVTAIGQKQFIPHEQISWTFGLAVMVAVQVFGHVSGSHINPIVTVAAATLGNIPLIQIPIYFVGQLLGALVGYGLLKAVTPEQFMGNILVQGANGTVHKTLGVCSPGLHPEVTAFQGFLVEFLATFILALVCCGVWDHRNGNKHDSVPIRFGFTIAVLAMAAGPYTGANMNPVRSFAPALFNGDWQNHWLYWAGPLLAGFVGALMYRVIFAKEPPRNEETPETLPLNDHHKA